MPSFDSLSAVTAFAKDVYWQVVPCVVSLRTSLRFDQSCDQLTLQSQNEKLQAFRLRPAISMALQEKYAMGVLDTTAAEKVR